MCAEQEFEHTYTWRMDMNVHVCRMWMQMHIQGGVGSWCVYRHICVYLKWSVNILSISFITICSTAFEVRQRILFDSVSTTLRVNKFGPPPTYIPCSILILSKLFYSPTDTLVNCLKNNFKICIKINNKTAPTCFGVVTPSSGSALMCSLMMARLDRNVSELFYR